MIYLIGSLRNPKVPLVAKELRQHGFDVFDEWYAAGPTTDEDWQRYESIRGRTYKEALAGKHAKDVFEFDLANLKVSDIGVLVLPCGKSAHLELGWMIGQGKQGYILFDKEPERYDIMVQFATGIFFDLEELVCELKKPNREETLARAKTIWQKYHDAIG